GLEDVAVQGDGALAEPGAVDAGAQGAADQALDLERAAALLAAGGLAVAAGVGGARQHAVFGGHPAFALAAQESRYALFHARGAQHPGVAEADQYRAFGVAGVAAFQAHLAKLSGGAAAGALDGRHGHRDRVAGAGKSSSRGAGALADGILRSRQNDASRGPEAGPPMRRQNAKRPGARSAASCGR